MQISSIEDVLRTISDNGGVLEVAQEFYPFDEQAERLGLITIKETGGAWGHTTELSLTNKGRHMIGIPVVTPPERISLATKVVSYFAKWRKPRASN